MIKKITLLVVVSALIGGGFFYWWSDQSNIRELNIDTGNCPELMGVNFGEEEEVNFVNIFPSSCDQ